MFALAAGMAIGLEQEESNMAHEAAGWSPPKEVQDLLIVNIPDGTQWYECRMALKVLSYPVDKYDSALKDAKALKRVFKAELFYCSKENGKLEAQRVW